MDCPKCGAKLAYDGTWEFSAWCTNSVCGAEFTFYLIEEGSIK